MSSRYGDEKYKKKIRKKFSSFLELSLTRSADGDSSEFTVECRMFCPHLFFSLVVAVVCCCCWIFLNVFLVDFDFCFFLVALETPTRVSLPNPIKRKTWQKKSNAKAPLNISTAIRRVRKKNSVKKLKIPKKGRSIATPLGFFSSSFSHFENKFTSDFLTFFLRPIGIEWRPIAGREPSFYFTQNKEPSQYRK